MALYRLDSLLKKLQEVDVDNKDVLRKIILEYQKCDAEICPSFDRIISLLLMRFSRNFETESQILVMNAICVLLKALTASNGSAPIQYINAIIKIHTPNNGLALDTNLTHNIKTIIQLYFVEGLLKSDILSHDDLSEYRLKILIDLFNIVEKSCMSCDKTSFVGFRGMYELMKCFTKFDYWSLLENTYISKILLIINSNWDNSVVGVRENNCRILHELLKNANRISNSEFSLETILDGTLKHLSWLNKSKYFILTELIKIYSSDFVFKELMKDVSGTIEHSSSSNENLQGKVVFFCDGLLSSLTVGGITSAGTMLFVEVWKGTIAKEYLQERIWLALRYEAMNVIQNLYNYWLPHIAKISPETLLYFYNELRKIDEPKLWFSLLCVLVLCRKNGLISFLENDQNTVDFINKCSINSNERLRCLSFEFVCVSPKTFVSPSSIEYRIIKKFLFCNANSDCTYLRQSVVTSFTLFVIRIRDSGLNNLKMLHKQGKSRSYDEQNIKNIELQLSEMCDFLLWLHEFLITNLNSEANYQRKYFSLIIYDVVLRYLNGGTESLENKRKGLCRKGHLKNQGVKIRDYLLEKNKWKYTDKKSLGILLECVSDATNDVRELATNMLNEYFVYADFYNAEQLILNALEMCNSTTFHETECGALYIVLLLNLQKQDEVQIIFNRFIRNTGANSRTIIGCLVKILEEQHEKFQSDCVDAVLTHNPMYGILTTLKFILNKCTINDTIMNGNDLADLLRMMENISSFCLKSLALKAAKTDFAVAPSFSEMDDSITHIISISNVFKQDEQTISALNLHQDVFNCIWMTLRLCTDISSSLGILLSGTSDYVNNFHHERDNIVEQCIRVVVSALTRCRHKGVIEGAGISLANLVRHITKQIPLSKLPDEILQKHILCTLSTTYKGPSMTRRGAGMGILFHKLIASDSRDNKPLLKSSMSRLLNILQNNNSMEKCDASEVNDIIEASVLHYIKGLVQDSSLKNDLAPYMSELSALAFQYFFDPSWPVRNAALQLFGAIVPKLVGQKKGMLGNIDDNNEEIQPCEGILHMQMDYLFVDVGELLLHYPDLTVVIQNTLQKQISTENTGNLIQSHASLVPVLSLLSGTIVGLSILYCDKLMNTIQDFRKVCLELLSSPIHVLRNLSAKAFACLTPLPWIQKTIVQLCSNLSGAQKENFKHGSLLTLSYLIDKYSEQGKHMFNECTTIGIRENILQLHERFTHYTTYYTRALYLNLLYSIKPCIIHEQWIESFQKLLETVILNDGHDPGLSLYVQNLTKHAVINCDHNNIPNIFNIIIKNFTCTDALKSFLTYLLKRLLTEKKHNNEIRNQEVFFNLVFRFLLKYHADLPVDVISLSLHLLEQIVNANIACGPVDLEVFYAIFIDSKFYSVNISSSALVVISSVIHMKFDSKSRLELDHDFIINLVGKVCDYAMFCSEDVRYNVVQSLNKLILILYEMCKSEPKFAGTVKFLDYKARCVDTVITLLQDENVRIRNEMTKYFASHMQYSGTYINPTVCLLMFLNSNILKELFGNRNLYLNTKLQSLKASEKDLGLQNGESLQYTPNVFYENFLLKKLITQGIQFADPVNCNSILDIYNESFELWLDNKIN